MTEFEIAPPILRPGSGRWPILLSVPHAGTTYPAALLREARHGRRSLESLEDPLVDRLIWRAASLGIGVVVARAPRALIDCNRGPLEMEGKLVEAPPGHDPGPRARHGLGLVPTRTPRDGELWRRPLTIADLRRRVDLAWSPYHRLLDADLEKLLRRHGEILLLDVHSMPRRAAHLPQLVIGDRHGRSAGRWLGDLVRQLGQAAGTSAVLNDPYAGGYIAERHGRPTAGVHALQLEFDRGTYLAADGRAPGDGFDAVARLIETIARRCGEALLDRQSGLEAAE